MSAQGATLRRGTVRLPVWPVTALVAAAAVAIGISLLGGVRPESSVATVTQTERLANSSAAIREQGAVAPTVDLTNSGVAIKHRGFAIRPNFEPTTAIREQGATLPVVVGISHVAPSAALHRLAGLPKVGIAPKSGTDPIMVNGEACMQCR
jgi:hypothetical protein